MVTGVPSIKASEVQILLMGVTLAPLLWWMLLRADVWPLRGWARASLVAILASYVATVIEGFAFEGFFNVIEHLGYAVAGVCFSVACASFLNAGTREPESER